MLHAPAFSVCNAGSRSLLAACRARCPARLQNAADELLAEIQEDLQVRPVKSPSAAELHGSHVPPCAPSMRSLALGMRPPPARPSCLRVLHAALRLVRVRALGFRPRLAHPHRPAPNPRPVTLPASGCAVRLQMAEKDAQEASARKGAVLQQLERAAEVRGACPWRSMPPPAAAQHGCCWGYG